MRKKRFITFLLIMAMLLSVWPLREAAAGEDITLAVWETVTLHARGSWYETSQNAENGRWIWGIQDETIVGGSSLRDPHGRF